MDQHQPGLLDFLKTAKSCMESGEYGDALSAFFSALNCDPDTWLKTEIYYQAAICRCRLKEYAQAIEYLDTALDIAADPEGANGQYTHIYELLQELRKLGPLGPQKWCPLLGTNFVIHGPGIQTCCFPQAVCLPSKGNLCDDLEQYKLFCSSLNDKLQEGLSTSCAGCQMLRDGYRNTELKIRTINISSGLPGSEHCNLKCVYCSYGKEIHACKYKYNVLEIFQHIVENIEPEHIDYAGGEITVSPYRDEILKLWKAKKIRGCIYTNAVIYNEKIADLLREGLITINCSVDAGTSKTFMLIKGVDCFEKVLGNLEKYAATGGGIILKYILLKGINDNRANIHGFIKFAKQLNANVVFSRDHRIAHTPVEGYERGMVARFIEICREQNIPYSLSNYSEN